jgi:hypothetical protein
VDQVGLRGEHRVQGAPFPALLPGRAAALVHAGLEVGGVVGGHRETGAALGHERLAGAEHDVRGGPVALYVRPAQEQPARLLTRRIGVEEGVWQTVPGRADVGGEPGVVTTVGEDADVYPRLFDQGLGKIAGDAARAGRVMDVAQVDVSKDIHTGTRHRRGVVPVPVYRQSVAGSGRQPQPVVRPGACRG